MTRRRILMTADTVGGVWQYAIELAGGLTALDVETVLVTLGPRASDEQRAGVAALDGVTLVETDLPLDWLCDGAGPIAYAGACIADLAAEHDADLVHLNMPTLAARAHYPAPVVAVTHGCISTWWRAAKVAPLDPAFAWHRELMREGLSRADLVVAPSAAYGRTIAAEYALLAPPLTVHNGRTAAELDPLPPCDMALTVGRLWDPVKGAAVLDRTAAALPYPFHAAGAVEGPHGERIALQHLQPIGHVGREALSQKLARQPIFVSAATFEPFGLAVLEAAQASCPLVLSDIATFRELWDGAALFVPPADADGYRGAIEGLIADRAARKRLGVAAKARAARYTPDRTAARMTDIYDALLATRPARRHAA